MGDGAAPAGTTNLISIGVGATLIGLTTYVPTYLQRSIGTTPIVAGLALAALTIGWPIAASFSGRIYLRLGFRPCVLIGGVLAVAGTVALALASPHPSVWMVALTCFVVGLGLGLIASPSLIAAQASVAWGERGVVTGANMFGRSLGSALGVAVLGAIANAVLRGRPEGDATAIVEASGAVFWAGAVAAAAVLVIALVMPRVRVLEEA